MAFSTLEFTSVKDQQQVIFEGFASPHVCNFLLTKSLICLEGECMEYKDSALCFFVVVVVFWVGEICIFLYLSLIL